MVDEYNCSTWIIGRGGFSELQAWRPRASEGFRKGLERNGPQAVRRVR